MDESYSIDLNDLVDPYKLKGNEKTLALVQNFVKKYPGKYDGSLIARMKRLGMKRPEWIPKEAWTPKKRQFNTQWEFIAQLAAFGQKTSEIAQKMDLNVQTVEKYLKDPELKLKVYEIQERIFGGNPRKLFRSALVEAFNTEIELMRDSKKDSIKLSAAQDILDRAAGKATQEINVNDSNIRSLIERLDKLERVGGVNAIEVSSNVQDAELSEMRDNQLEPKENIVAVTLDPVDQWLRENNECLSDLTGKSP